MFSKFCGVLIFFLCKFVVFLVKKTRIASFVVSCKEIRSLVREVLRFFFPKQKVKRKVSFSKHRFVSEFRSKKLRRKVVGGAILSPSTFSLIVSLHFSQDHQSQLVLLLIQKLHNLNGCEV